MVVVKRVLWKSGLKVFARAYEVAFGRTEIPFLTSIIKPHGLHPPTLPPAPAPCSRRVPRGGPPPTRPRSARPASGVRPRERSPGPFSRRPSPSAARRVSAMLPCPRTQVLLSTQSGESMGIYVQRHQPHKRPISDISPIPHKSLASSTSREPVT